jgi:hypothetical protein
MSVIGSSIIAGASGQSVGDYNLTKSLRFRSSASAYLNRTPAGAGNQKTWTWSGWVKRGTLGTNNFGLIFCDTGSNSNKNEFGFFSADSLFFEYTTGGSTQGNLYTTQVFRDPSAWYHIILAVDTTQATASNRIKMYVNGSQITSFSTATYPSQNTDMYINSTNVHDIGRGNRNAGTIYLDAYLTEINFVDGQALTPSSFGETSTTTGVWIPKKYSGSYGTNGFYLDFKDTSSTAALGYDAAGSNDWTVNNISLTAGITYDSMTDVPTLTSATASNYATLNPLKTGTGATLSGGNLNYTCPGSNSISLSTIGMSSGKWYCEYVFTSAFGNPEPGIARDNVNLQSYLGSDANGWLYYGGNGQKYTSGSGAAYGATFTTNDIIGIAFDADAGTLTFYKNNTSQGTAFTGLTNGPYFFGCGATSQDATFNFGQRPFAYTPPSGFKALNTFNLSTPTIGATAATLASKNMNIALYTGTGSSQSITGLGFQPDWTWIKERNAAADHGLYDAVRGVQKQIESNNTGAETTETTGLTTFGSDGFTVGSLAQLNTSADTYVAWNWKANGAGSSNTVGSITSTVSANTSAGFSIVTYTGTGSNATVGHGLGVAPSMVIVKRRDTTGNWGTWHTSIANTNYLLLNTTAASTSGTTYWNSTTPTSTVFSIGTSTDVNANTGTYVAYCFAPIAGYSAFGSYTGTGVDPGPFVYTGFRPRFIMIKRTDTASGVGWWLYDTSTSTYNYARQALNPNLSGAEQFPLNEGGGGAMDILSNGFKCRGTYEDINASGGTYIYMAFAESPFNYANAR